MVSEITFRPLEAANSESVYAIICEQSAPGLPDWTASQVLVELTRGGGLGAFENGKLVAFIIYEDMGDRLDILFVATTKDFQRQGLMTSLFNSLDRGKSSPTLWLEVHEANVKARNLYKRLGFVEIGKRPNYYRDGGTAILYNRG